MHQVFQFSRRMQAHLKCHFDSCDALYVPKAVRGGEFSKTLLPLGTGLGATNQGRDWSNSELLQRGYEAAELDGANRINEEVAVRYGLLAAARLQPIQLCEGESRPLMRMALFDGSAIANESADIVDMVVERLSKLVHKHLSDDVAKFDRWFFPGHGNLVKVLAGGPRSRGGKLSNEQVTNALLFLGWESYQYVMDCHQMFNFWFRRALPAPLDSAETHVFDHVYRPQPYLGNMALILLVERCGLISPILAELWENPADEYLVGVLHRLLQMYAEMATARRKVDRLLKQKAESGAGSEMSNRDWSDQSAPEPAYGLFEMIAALIAEENELRCLECDESWTARVDSLVPPQPGDPIVLELACTCRRVVRTVTLDEADFRRIAAPELKNRS
jgi:hypothetical protein